MTYWPLSLAAGVCLALMLWNVGHRNIDGAAANGMGFVFSLMLLPLWDWAYRRVAGWWERREP